MIRARWVLALAGVMWVLSAVQSQAQYRPPPRREEPPAEDEFGDSVDLKRFRRGNIGWDTQELIASGLTALHEDHQEILEELRELRDRLQALEEKLGSPPPESEKP